MWMRTTRLIGISGEWQPRGIIWANSPVVKGNMIYICIGYDYPAKMLKVNDDVTYIEEVYTSNLLDNHHHGLIELDGYLYGSYWVHNNAGNWACINWDTGEVMYDETWNSKGQLVYADGLFPANSLVYRNKVIFFVSIYSSVDSLIIYVPVGKSFASHRIS